MAGPYRKQWFKKSSSSSSSSSFENVYRFEVTPRHGYYGFQLYFNEATANEDFDKIIKNTRAFEGHIHRNSGLFPPSKIKETCAYAVDLNGLSADDEFLAEWDGFKDEIVSNTEECLRCMGLAMHQTVTRAFEKPTAENSFSTAVIRPRLINFQPLLQWKNLRVNSYGKLVSIRGTVIKAGVTKLSCQRMAFSCDVCTSVQVVAQVDGNYSPPTKCLTKGCRNHSNFKPMLSSSNTTTINCQTIKLQELVGDEQGDNSRMPRTVECELTEDLVGCCVPGDDITVTGIVKARNTGDVYSKNKQPSVFLLYIDCVSVVNEKTRTQLSASSAARITFNTKDYYAIQKIHAEPMLFRFLVHSLCPSIYGHEMVKAGLLLALFGGTQNEMGIRPDSHVLMVGDPGLGKSQMLKACSNVAPRGVYVCGNTSTGTGLTVTMTRESGSEYALEAGALILADQGCCCIDEFDKMTTQHACLLEVMEQQCISIAKAGVSCNLPTRASVLAAANPVGGHYNKSKTVSENLKIKSPLLSRFDLVFILLDQPNNHLDKLLSEHVLALHSGRQLNQTLPNPADSSATANDCVALKDRLKLLQGKAVDHLPHSLFRKYIAYAQKYVHPLLNSEAQEVLKKFYLELRKQYHVGDCTPVTARQLESLQRLTQARAKVELREEATAEDAIDVVEIMRHSLVDVFSDELGALDFTRSPNGTGISSRKQVANFLRLLQQRSEADLKSTFDLKELQQVAHSANVPKDRFFNTIQSLNIQGVLLMKGGDTYQLGYVPNQRPIRATDARIFFCLKQFRKTRSRFATMLNRMGVMDNKDTLLSYSSKRTVR